MERCWRMAKHGQEVDRGLTFEGSLIPERILYVYMIFCVFTAVL